MKKLFFYFTVIFLINGYLHSQPCVSNCSLYTVSSLTAGASFAPTNVNSETSLLLSDDQVSGTVPIGFTFSFMCASYTSCIVSSNGFLSFNPNCSQGCCAGQFCPTLNGNPNNYVAFAWCDLYPPGGGTIKYQTIGLAPNRIFVLTYSVIPFCCTSSPPFVTGQIKLFETTNIIEIHNGVVGSGGTKTQGIMNLAGTAGVAVVGRNATNFTTNGDAFRFTPTGGIPAGLGPIVGNASVCLGSTTTYSVPAVVGASSYSWTLPLGWTGSSITNTISAISGPSGTMSITATYSCGVSPPATFVVNTVNSVPVVTITSGNTPCVGSVINLTASGANSFTWNTGAISNAISPIPISNTIYTLIANNACGNSTASINVIVNPSPTITTISSTPSLCSGASATLVASGASTYTWSGGVTNGIGFQPLTTTIYTVTGTSVLGCTSTAVIGITVGITPTSPPLASPPILCSGNSSTISAAGATNFTWNPGNSNSQSIIVTPTITTTYTSITSNLNCYNTQTVTVVVNPLPTIITIASPNIVCAGKSSTLTGGGAVSYTWTQGTFTLNGVTVIVTPTITTVYTVTAFNGSCSAIATLTIPTLVTPTISVVPSSSTICYGNTATLTATGATSYTWSPPIGLNTAVVNVNPLLASSYSVSGTNSVGCISGTTQIILVTQNPILTVGATPSFVCVGGASSATVTGANTYSWSTGSTASITAVNPLVTSIYTVTGTYSNTGCKTTQTVTVVAFEPTLTVTSSTAVCLGSSITLNAAGAVSYTWNTGAFTPAIIVSPMVYTIYSISATTSSLVAGYNLNCLASNTIGVTVNQNPTITATCTRTLICRGESTTLFGNGGFTYNWLSPLSAAGSSISVSPISTIIYTTVGTNQENCSGTATIQIKVSACVGIEDVKNNQIELVTIYPNPSNGEFSIKSLKDFNLSLINELGQLVKVFCLNESNNHFLKITDLANGIYFIVGGNLAHKVNEKVIIIK